MPQLMCSNFHIFVIKMLLNAGLQSLLTSAYALSIFLFFTETSYAAITFNSIFILAAYLLSITVLFSLTRSPSSITVCALIALFSATSPAIFVYSLLEQSSCALWALHLYLLSNFWQYHAQLLISLHVNILLLEIWYWKSYYLVKSVIAIVILF